MTPVIKLLHSPSLVAEELPSGYETWPPIGLPYAFVIGWSKYSLGLPQSEWIEDSHDWLEFPPFFRGH